ncbi:MAG: cell division protein FtsL [Leptothrix sp. (in: b-proteobacteria)]
MMTRINIVLLLLLIGSAVYLVQTSYEARQLFVALEGERSAASQLGLEAERLQVELRAQATHLRVEQVARERLHMRNSSPAVTQYVDDQASAPTRSTP